MALAALAVAALGCAAWMSRREQDPSLSRVQAAGVLRVGYAVEPPYAWLAPDATVQGEAAVVVQAVARTLSLEVHWVLTDFDSLLSQLVDGRFDLVAAGMYITPQRRQRVRFSRPTLRVRPGWLTAAGNPKQLAAYDALRHRTDVRVAVLAGSFEQSRLVELGLSPAAIMVVPDAQSGLSAVKRAAVDGLALSLPAVVHLAAHASGRLQALAAEDGGDGAHDSLVALAFGHEAAALQHAVDGVLSSYIGSAAHLAALVPLGLGAEDLPMVGHGRG